jgi:RNase P subunit RPR2
MTRVEEAIVRKDMDEGAREKKREMCARGEMFLVRLKTGEVWVQEERMVSFSNCGPCGQVGLGEGKFFAAL